MERKQTIFGEKLTEERRTIKNKFECIYNNKLYRGIFYYYFFFCV